MRMHNPPHPGEMLREDCLKPLGLSVTAAAKWLRVSRGTLSEFLNGHNGVSAEMAIRLEKAGWGSAESWLRNQVTYDLWRAQLRSKTIKVKKFPAAA
jgi:antitoxin HigA-1